MKDLSEYKRIGTDYYREVLVPKNKNNNLKCLQKWNKQTIIDDFGKDAPNKLRKYNGFCCIPSHDNFKKEINGFYNRYEALSYPLNQVGEWHTIAGFIQHIFGEQYHLGLDYLSIILKDPVQVLPILCLVSDEKNTGKTTFLNLMKQLLEANMTVNTNEEFRSQFNSDWVGKVMIAIDEVLLDKREDSERIKNLSTARYYKVEAKGKDKEEIEFFGKFILCSNHEENFIKIEANEIRYWVRKIPSLGTSINADLLDELRNEIPFFANFLLTRSISTEKKTRMWFTKEQIHTEALDLLKRGNITSIEKELEEMLLDEFGAFTVDNLCYTTKNLHEMLKKRGVLCSSGAISKILLNKYGLVPTNSSYKWYRSDILNYDKLVNDGYTTEKGRFYAFERSLFAK